MKKSFTPLGIGTEEWRLTAFPAGKNAARLTVGGKAVMEIGRCRCGGFSELSVLPELFRLHRAEDGFSAEFESSGVIPFGTEFEVTRKITAAANTALMTSLISPRNGGAAGDIALEEIVFPGPWTEVRYLLFGDSRLHRRKFREDGEIYRGPELPWFIQAESGHGGTAEFITGGDIWRHRAAEKLEGVTAEFRIADVGGNLVFERNILRYGEEILPEKRPWQFESLFSWSAPTGEKDAEAQPLAVPGCLASRKVQRSLRSAVRRAPASLRLTGYESRLCTDAAHLERPAQKKLEHRDLNDLFQFYCWGNRQLGRRGFSLTVEAGPSSPPGMRLLENLSAPPLPLQEENFADEINQQK